MGVGRGVLGPAHRAGARGAAGRRRVPADGARHQYTEKLKFHAELSRYGLLQGLDAGGGAGGGGVGSGGDASGGGLGRGQVLTEHVRDKLLALEDSCVREGQSNAEDLMRVVR
eukprot:91592-Chlamydomonas_euryale.AAC.1